MGNINYKKLREELKQELKQELIEELKRDFLDDCSDCSSNDSDFIEITTNNTLGTKVTIKGDFINLNTKNLLINNIPFGRFYRTFYQRPKSECSSEPKLN